VKILNDSSTRGERRVGRSFSSFLSGEKEGKKEKKKRGENHLQPRWVLKGRGEGEECNDLTYSFCAREKEKEKGGGKSPLACSTSWD